MKKYLVKSIFGPTIEGEGSNVGKPVNFVRLSGCNRWTGRDEHKHESICKFCDTDFLGGDRLTAGDILEKLTHLDGTIEDVVISGGEPMLQLDIDLVTTIKKIFKRVHLETNGSRVIPDSLYRALNTVVMSPKQSREETKLTVCTDLKILYPFIDDRITTDAFQFFPAVNKFIQPVMDQNYDLNLFKCMQFLYKNPGWRLSVQLHKIIGAQ